MARQKGLVPVVGAVGDVHGYQLIDNPGIYYMAKNGGPTKQQYDNWDSMQRTRENSWEFSASSYVAGKIYRNIDLDLRQKLRKTFYFILASNRAVIEFDTMNERGKRSILLTDADQNYNNIIQDQALSGNIIYEANNADWEEFRDKTTGIVTLNFPNGIKTTDINPPPGATHYTVEILNIFMSNYNYEDDVKKYVPVDSINKYMRLISGYIDISVDTAVPFSITCNTGQTTTDKQCWITDYIIEFWTHLGPHQYLKNGPSHDIIMSAY